jgi:NAD(P)-dependent dehydrogenase (short-subunit alcohol dehydrogenase family)
MVEMRNVIITGAAGGMGSATLAQLVDREVNVVAVDLDQAAVQGVIDGLGSTRGEFVAVGADVSDEQAVKGFIQLAVDRWGGLDGLFNIAGIEGEVAPMIDQTVENFDRLVAVNARSVFLGMVHALPHLRNRGGGAIVSTGSYLAVRGFHACGLTAAPSTPSSASPRPLPSKRASTTSEPTLCAPVRWRPR